MASAESFDLFVTRLAAAGFSADDIVEEALALPDVAPWVAADPRRVNVVEAEVRRTYPGFPSLLQDQRVRTVPVEGPKPPAQAVLAKR